MNIALIHDYLAQDGGAEQVLRAFHAIWPDAPLFVLFENKGSVPGFEEAEIRHSFLQRFPFLKKSYQYVLPFMPLATESYDLSGFDVILSDTSAFAKGIIPPSNALHICYCHTPTRYLWTDTHSYIASLPYPKPLKWMMPLLIHRLRAWDQQAVDRVDHFIANSNTVRRRIEQYYRRQSDIIFPPINTDRFRVADRKEEYFVSGGRLVAYKRFDLLIEAANRLELPLKIFGTGPMEAKLRAHAGPSVTFLGRVSDERHAKLLANAKAFLHPQLEDFGITPVEAMAAGCPVIAYGKGGVTESVLNGTTGLFFNEQSVDSLIDAIKRFEEYDWDAALIKAHAEKFSTTTFKTTMKQYVESRYAEFLQEIQRCQLSV